MITGLPEWNPSLWDEATNTGSSRASRGFFSSWSYPITGVKNGNDHEKQSILGMVMRLGIFARDWVSQICCIF
jgi:hypothetical protein